MWSFFKTIKYIYKFIRQGIGLMNIALSLFYFLVAYLCLWGVDIWLSIDINQWLLSLFSPLEISFFCLTMAAFFLLYAIANQLRKSEECELNVQLDCEFKIAKEDGNLEYEIVLLVTNISEIKQINDVHVSLTEKLTDTAQNPNFHTKKIGAINPSSTECLKALKMITNIETGEIFYPPPIIDNGNITKLSFTISADTLKARKHCFMIKMEKDIFGFYSPRVHEFIKSPVRVLQ